MTKPEIAIDPKPKTDADKDKDLTVKEWAYPVSAPRKVSDNFADHKERKSVDPGTDYVKARGSRVRSIAAGRVILADKNPDGARGRAVYIDHGNGLVTHYLHLDTVTVRIGVRVVAGTIIGTVGGSGFGKNNHYGDHLHFSVLRHGVHRDPERFLSARIPR